MEINSEVGEGASHAGGLTCWVPLTGMGWVRKRAAVHPVWVKGETDEAFRGSEVLWFPLGSLLWPCPSCCLALSASTQPASPVLCLRSESVCRISPGQQLL